MSLSTAAICLIACHGGPADHFATFAEDLTKKGYPLEIHASGPALEKFESRGFSAIPFSIEEPADIVAQKCTHARLVITDLGHVFAINLQKALAEGCPFVSRWAYYDNPEFFVPGGYSDVAVQVMELAQKVLFANSNLVDAFFPEKAIPIDYYPMSQVQKIKQRRKEEHAFMRSQFFSNHSLEDKGQKVLVYVGGNNEEYFSKAFPAFLSFFDELPQDRIVILQQHPGATKENKDKNQIQGRKIFVSDFSSDDAQVLADVMLYYQTSMAPQFVLADIPVIQVGHEPYDDIVVRNRLCSVATTKEAFSQALVNLTPNLEVEEAIQRGLGIDDQWPDRLEQAIRF